jgi:hypothetical protein
MTEARGRSRIMSFGATTERFAPKVCFRHSIARKPGIRTGMTAYGVMPHFMAWTIGAPAASAMMQVPDAGPVHLAP